MCSTNISSHNKNKYIYIRLTIRILDFNWHGKGGQKLGQFGYIDMAKSLGIYTK